ncbi:MAG: xanthine dehydrogenase accessory protein XdhC [Alphaproteobacteria bacterium]|nr:xanthine dehydrogenase accessory protein XdhC [Alphaproteobacteria bacterium]
MPVWFTIHKALARDEYCALVSVADAKGSAPREAGARMVVLCDGGFTGTIGGGALEWRAIAGAQAAIAGAVTHRSAPSPRIIQQALGPDLGQCCGGMVRLLLEVFEPARLSEVEALAKAEAAGPFTTEGRIEDKYVTRTIVDGAESSYFDTELIDGSRLRERFGRRRQPLALFGAGHVGRALVLALAPLDFSTAWIDPRDGAFPPAMPGDVRMIRSRDPAAELPMLPEGAFVLVMTHSHALDYDVVHAALSARRFAYVGLIGSVTKRTRFRNRLRQAGVEQTDIDKLVCPIGIEGVKSKQPAAIAASVVADLLVRMDALTFGKNQKTKAPRIVAQGMPGRGMASK